MNEMRCKIGETVMAGKEFDGTVCPGESAAMTEVLPTVRYNGNGGSAMIPKHLEGVLVSTPDTLSGAVRFAGTRVPVQALLDTLMSNHSVDDFLEGYPNVCRDQAEAVVRWEQDISRTVFDLEIAA